MPTIFINVMGISESYTRWVHENGRALMQLAFASSALAALCNSEAAMTARWGAPAAAKVGRRLLDLAAVPSGAIGVIPGAAVKADGSGEVAITFHEEIRIRGVITAQVAAPDRILITSLDVHEGDTDE